MKLYAEMSDEELEQVDLEKFTNLSFGDRVSHKNAGQHGGNGTTISSQLGTVIDHQNQGINSWGGLCVTVTVKWDNGEQYNMIHSLAKKESK